MKSLGWKGNKDVSGNRESSGRARTQDVVRQDNVVEETTLKFEAIRFLQKTENGGD